MLITRQKNILVLGQGMTQGLDDTTLTAEKTYSINFTENNNKFCLSLHYNEELIVIYLLMVQKLLNLKQKTPKL